MKKYLFGVLLGLVLIPSAFVSAQTTEVFTITPVVSTILTKYSSSSPETPDLQSLHTVKIKPSKNIKLIRGNVNFKDSNGTNYVTNGARFENKLDNVIISANGVDLQAGKEYYLSVATIMNTNQLFAGTYRSVLGAIHYSIDGENDYQITNIQTTQQVAIVGEKAPYIKSISPNRDVTPGSKVTIIGERLNNATINLYAQSSGGRVFSTPSGSDTGKAEFIASSSTQPGAYSLVVSNKYGESNKNYFSLVGPQPTITNVQFYGINLGWVTQGTSTPLVFWNYSGTLPNVDVLVCYLRTGQSDACFFAHQNIKNIGRVFNVRIGTNIPINSMAYIKVRKAGTDTVMAKSSQFKVVKTEDFASVGLESVSNIALINTRLDTTSSDDTGEYTITFKVTALTGDTYIPLTAYRSTSSLAGVVYSIKDDNNVVVTTGITSASLARVSGGLSATLDGQNYIKLINGQTATLRLRISFDPASTGLYRAQLSNIGFKIGLTGSRLTNQVVTPATSFETSLINIQNSPIVFNNRDVNQIATVLASLENLLNSLKQSLGLSN